MPYKFNPSTATVQYIPEELQVEGPGLNIVDKKISINIASETTPGIITAEDYGNFKSKKSYKFNILDVKLTAQQIAEQKVTLPVAPDFPDTTILSTSGIMQNYGEDYQVVGNDLIWSGMGLDGFLEEDELIRIFYQIGD
jgi:hypothetical protein